MTLQDCAKYYRQFTGRNYRFTLEKEIVVTFGVRKAHFKHLLGLAKLSDIRGLERLSANAVFSKALSDPAFSSAVSRSSHFPLIQNRLRYFGALGDLLAGKGRFVIDFDPALVPSGTFLRSTDYILYLKKDGGYVNLTIGGGLDGHYPETFFFEPSRKYITDQILLDILHVEEFPYRPAGDSE